MAIFCGRLRKAGFFIPTKMRLAEKPAFRNAGFPEHRLF